MRTILRSHPGWCQYKYIEIAGGSEHQPGWSTHMKIRTLKMSQKMMPDSETESTLSPCDRNTGGVRQRRWNGRMAAAAVGISLVGAWPWLVTAADMSAIPAPFSVILKKVSSAPPARGQSAACSLRNRLWMRQNFIARRCGGTRQGGGWKLIGGGSHGCNMPGFPCNRSSWQR